ncbi:MAG: cation-translocating P-type ATPase C-terminal domain-containing protein [Desulfomonilaceae bacterium]|nr:cation-translocating P-type ATPase C-terminal domain-containing protein [Desulfomonilaceae bacterium]
MVTNGIQDVAPAFEGGEPGAMKRKPRLPDEGIFDSQMIGQTVASGLTIGVLAFGLWYWLINGQVMGEASARNSGLLLMVLLQNVHVFNCRSERVSALKVALRRDAVVIFGVANSQSIHILSMHVPLMQTILGTEPVTFFERLTYLSPALVVLLVMEAFKWIRRTQ